MSDVRRPGTEGLSDRAAVAMLTLQLRTAQKELLDIRGSDADPDLAGACAELRARLEPLEAERRGTLDEALQAARAESATAIEAARRRADELVESARSEAALRAPLVVIPPTAPVEEHPAADVIDTTATDDLPEELPADELNWADDAVIVAEPVAETEPVVVAEPVTTPAAAQVPALPNVVLDAETFARVFATVIAETIEKTRAESQQPYPQSWQQPPGAPYLGGVPPNPYGQYPYYPPMQQPPKQGFWSHARHPDVLLLGLATVIVLVIMVAWLS